MKADAKTEKEILDLLNEYAEAYVVNDTDRIISDIAPDPDVVFIGTGSDEWIEGRENVRKGMERDLAQADSVRLDFHDIKVSSAGPVAWASCQLTVNVVSGGEQATFNSRFTATFERRDGKWLFVQSHNSLPWSEQEIGQSFPDAQ